MTKVYFISGLGADERAFQYLDLTYCEPVFVRWLKPHRNETISAYAARMYEQINDPGAIIVGLSFGGMIAMQIASQFPVKKVILLSSCRNRKELPPYLRSLKYLPLHRLMRSQWLKWGNHTAYRLMGISSRHDKIVFTNMLKVADNEFIRWALNAIIHWKVETDFSNIVHIHGDGDYILPCRYVKADMLVKRGDHLMVLSMPQKISPLLKEAILF
jgi:pimeloyl-ACP methyl ester carboxylesterase